MHTAISLWRTRLAVVLAAFALLPAAGRADDVATPGSHSSPGSVAPASQAGSHGFKCGDGYCDARRQYCETIKTDAPEWPTDYACMPLPQACGAAAKSSAPGCSCFAPGTRCDFCSAVEQRAGGSVFYRTCVGGH